MMQEFHKKGGDINARDAYATPRLDLPILAPGRKCSEPCPRALPYLAENTCVGATPVPPYPLFFGGYPHPGYPAPFVFLVSSLHAQPRLCRVPLVHAAAAWHREGRTPLMDAVRFGATAAVASLIKLRANLDAQHRDYG